MTEVEQNSEQPEDDSPSPRPIGRQPIPLALTVLMEAAVASIPVAGAFWMIGSFGRESKLDVWICLTIAGAGALTASCWAALVRRRFWSKPARTLQDALERARQGDTSIEELDEVIGPMAPLASAVQEILQLEKLRQAKLLETEREVRGRIANRTDALERKIGSLQHQALRDALTGLFNRRAMERELPRMVTEHLAAARDACLLMIDVDHFKTLNDTLGHAAGDNLLKEIGQIIRSTIREDDMAFRCGGDEFVVLLSNLSQTAGQAVGLRLESLVAVLARPLHLPLPPRLSIGVCALSDLEAPSPEALLEVADKRLYALKSSRNSHRKTATPTVLKKSA